MSFSRIGHSKDDERVGTNAGSRARQAFQLVSASLFALYSYQLIAAR